MGAAGFAAAGFVGAWAPGFVPGTVGGFCAGGWFCTGGGDCATDVSTSTSKQTQAMNGVFIVLLISNLMERLRYRSVFIAKSRLASPAKLFTFLLPESDPCFQYHQRQDVRQVFHIIIVAQVPSDVRQESRAIATLFRKRGQSWISASSSSPE